MESNVDAEVRRAVQQKIIHTLYIHLWPEGYALCVPKPPGSKEPFFKICVKLLFSFRQSPIHSIATLFRRRHDLRLRQWPHSLLYSADFGIGLRADFL